MFGFDGAMRLVQLFDLELCLGFLWRSFGLFGSHLVVPQFEQRSRNAT